MGLKILNFNAYRAADEKRVKHFMDLIQIYKPLICTIQEIHIGTASRVFGKEFNVIINIEQTANDHIGVCTLVHKSIKINDYVIGINGRIIGISIGSVKIFNVYPKSGAQSKKQRDLFFNEDLPNLIQFWKKGQNETMIFAGDFNCIHRREDSLNNPDMHIQKALIKFMKVFKLADDFITLKGQVTGVFSRITNRSRTRIDTILSNMSGKCKNFDYVDFPHLDHKVIFAEYETHMSYRKNEIPKGRFLKNWVISRELEKDSYFNDLMACIFEQFKIERERSQDKFDPSFVWFKLKETLLDVAKKRAEILEKIRKQEYMRILEFYQMAKEDISNGKNCNNNLKMIIQDLNEFYRETNEVRIRDAQFLDIKDNVYDINKSQKAKQFENGNHIDRIRVDGVVYDHKFEMVNAVEGKMRGELKSFHKDLGSPMADSEDAEFLNLLPKLKLSDEEIGMIEGEVTSAEVENILENEVNLDSSPGIDGLTYRFIKHFWGNQTFREVYMAFINYIKISGNFGRIENVGLMVLKNKKGNSIEYDKKRKITKLNKDINLLGKVWSNRCRDVILDKIIPGSQFVCRKDKNIVDELRHLRDANLYLLENKVNGSILSLDYANAFRSVSLRWFDLVMKKIGFPKVFIEWYWNMFRNIGILISFNKCKSSVIQNTRGFLEGSPPSMLTWVLASMPLIIAIENRIQGITLRDGRVFKSKNYADDQKIFLSQVKEIDIVNDIVVRFEKVSGVKLHRNRELKKCNLLNFGSHRDYQGWPTWVNKCHVMKVVGGIFIDEGSLEKVNSGLVKTKCIGKMLENWGLRGTLSQRVYFVNTFCLSKMNFISQVFKIEPKVIKEIKMRCLQFIYVGYNERPVQVVNYRKREDGGLGLVEPECKAKSLLLHNMYREYLEREISLDGGKLGQDIYGFKGDFLEILRETEPKVSAKDIYSRLIVKITHVNNTLINSRIERRISGVKWTRSFKNIRNLSMMSSKEKEFAFLLYQDLLPVKGRIHRQNADKRCLRMLRRGEECQLVQDRIHFFIKCDKIKNDFNVFLEFIEIFLERKVSELEILHLSFSVSNKKRTWWGVWVAVKFFYYMYAECLTDIKEIMKIIRKDIGIFKMLRVEKCWSTELMEMEGMVNSVIE